MRVGSMLGAEDSKLSHKGLETFVSMWRFACWEAPGAVPLAKRGPKLKKNYFASSDPH